MVGSFRETVVVWMDDVLQADLFLGETTVKTHVGRVLMKLHLRDRVQAVVLAYEHGLVRPGGG
jgi:hypothetical protein